MSLEPTGRSGFKIIEQDYASIMAGLFASTILVQQSTFGGEMAYSVMIGLSLILTGIVFSIALKVFKKAPQETPKQVSNIALWAFVALFAFVVTSFFVPAIRFTSASIVVVQTFWSQNTFNLNSQSAITGAFIFIGVLIPNAEEQFFRGLWGNVALSSFRKFPEAGVVVGGSIFAIFHFAVYGLNYYTLGILFVDGMTMIVVDSYATGRIATSIGAHMGNNMLAFGVGAGIVGGFIPHAVVAFTPLVYLAIPSFMLFRAYRGGRLNLPSVITRTGGLR